MAPKLRIVITYANGPPQIFERNVEAPVDDVSAATSMGMIAFDEAFTLGLEWATEEAERRRTSSEHAT